MSRLAPSERLQRTARLGVDLLARARDGLDQVRARRSSGGASPRGVAFAGTVWTGGDAEPAPGVVFLDAAGRIVRIHTGDRPDIPSDLLVLGGPRSWVVPGITDAHVHLGVATDGRPSLDALLGLRDLGAPMPLAAQLRTPRGRTPDGGAIVVVAGPILTAVGGYPSTTWGSGGYAEFITSPAQARSLVHHLASEGVDVIKLALEPGGSDLPVPGPMTCQAAVDAAHAAGLPAVAHARTIEMVRRALDIGVDELVHVPTERMPPELVDRIASAGVSVTSTLQTFFSSGVGRDAAANAADLVAAGVVLRYGTDLGNDGTRPGVDPRELDRLADTGLGRLGAARAATEHAAAAPGMRGRTGMLSTGLAAELVLLPSSPMDEPGVWLTPSAVHVDGALHVGRAAAVAGSGR